jgi:hypothetical protein
VVPLTAMPHSKTVPSGRWSGADMTAFLVFIIGDASDMTTRCWEFALSWRFPVLSLYQDSAGDNGMNLTSCAGMKLY